MKIIVAGSRTINDKNFVFVTLEKTGFKITELVSGGAKGVDSIAEEWAKEREIPIKRFLPHYTVDNAKFAPLIRNTDMAGYADGLIAVWDGKSKGTQHMINCMEKLRKPIEISEIL